MQIQTCIGSVESRTAFVRDYKGKRKSLTGKSPTKDCTLPLFAKVVIKFLYNLPTVRAEEEGEMVVTCKVILYTYLVWGNNYLPIGFAQWNPVTFNLLNYNVVKLHCKMGESFLKCTEAICNFHTMGLNSLKMQNSH